MAEVIAVRATITKIVAGYSVRVGHPLLQDRQTLARKAERRALGSLVHIWSSPRLIHLLMQKPTPTPKKNSTV